MKRSKTRRLLKNSDYLDTHTYVSRYKHKCLIVSDDGRFSNFYRLNSKSWLFSNDIVYFEKGELDKEFGINKCAGVFDGYPSDYK